MLVKLGESNKFLSAKIDRETVKEMVSAYRKRTEVLHEPLWYAHFGIRELFDFLIDNKVISEGAKGHINTPDEGEGFGLKIYIGNHNKTENCPRGREKEYLKKDTTILCNTIIKDAKAYQYKDLLKEKRDSILISDIDASGDGLDQTSTYPPDNPFVQTTSPGTKDESLDIGANYAVD